MNKEKEEISKDIKTANKQFFELAKEAIEGNEIEIPGTFMFAVEDVKTKKASIVTHVLKGKLQNEKKEGVTAYYALQLAKAKKENKISDVLHISMIAEAYMSKKDAKNAKKDIETELRKFDRGEMQRPSEDPESVDAVIVTTMDNKGDIIFTIGEVKQKLNNKGDIIRYVDEVHTSTATEKDARAAALSTFWNTYRMITV